MDQRHLEEIAQEICEVFEVYAPPIPIEIMLQKPLPGMWDEVDVNQLSGSFLSIKERYSPRMSLARLLVRHICASDWGQDRGLGDVLGDSETINTFARMLIMPEEMVNGLTSSNRNPKTMSMHFEAPEEDARQRLLEML